MFVLTDGVLPAAAKSERLLLLMATTPHSKVIRHLQPLRSSVMQRGCKLGSAPCVTFRVVFFFLFFSAGCVCFKGVGWPRGLERRRPCKHRGLMRGKQTAGPWNNSREMTDRESLNQHNVSAGISLTLNQNTVSWSVDINCSKLPAFGATSPCYGKAGARTRPIRRDTFKERQGAHLAQRFSFI